MPSGPLAFKETDVARAVRACRKAGLEIGRVEIGRDGRISVLPASAVPAQGDAAPAVQADAALDDELTAWRAAIGDD